MKYELEIRDEAPEAEVKAALAKVVETMAQPRNSEGVWILWSDTAWNCGTIRPLTEEN